jgi:hypothetical protein
MSSNTQWAVRKDTVFLANASFGNRQDRGHLLGAHADHRRISTVLVPSGVPDPRMFFGLLDIIYLYGYGSFHQQAKKGRKPLISTVL